MKYQHIDTKITLVHHTTSKILGKGRKTIFVAFALHPRYDALMPV